MSKFSKKLSNSREEAKYVIQYMHFFLYGIMPFWGPTTFLRFCLFTVLKSQPYLSFQILDTVAEIQERHDAVRDLERKLLELQQVTFLT